MKMIKTAIILAAGFGNRLRSVVSDVPKPMAQLNGKVFLEYIFIYLEKQEIKRVVLHVGYKKEKIIEYFGNKYGNIEITYSKVEEPIGTGAGIKDSLKYIEENEDNVLVLNGDSYFDINIADYYEKFLSKNAILGLALKPMKNYDRYGSVIVDANNKILEFEEKKKKESGLINGGVYIIKRNIFEKYNIKKEEFSFETEIMEKYVGNGEFYGFEYDGYFIDIGIPKDYEKAKEYFK